MRADETSVVGAVAELRAEGHDVDTIASLLLNGAAALLIESCTAEEFGELAKRMWRTADRQVELLSLLDRITQKREFRVKPKRKRAALKPLREGAAS